MALRWLIFSAVLAFGTPGHADGVIEGDATTDERHDDVHVVRAAFESSVVLLIPTAYYWRTTEHQFIDWTLGWDTSSWYRKLVTFDAVKFDTNPFIVNSVRHPFTGMLDYHVARTNGIGMAGSAIFAFASGAVWEYLIEFRESPSINDMIMNTSGGIAIGEPLWQLGQIWRGSDASLGDRALTAAFSPFDALHDEVFERPHWHRRRTWHAIELSAGLATIHREDDSVHHALVLAGDAEVITDPLHASGRDGARTISPGSWSRVRGAIGLAPAIASTAFHSRTAIAGRYSQRDGVGVFVGVGSAFTYHRDRIPDGWDHAAFAHLVGPQLQLSRRTGSTSLRWDAAAYADFAMMEANAFSGELPFPPPPPYLTTLQANGYYHGGGGTVTTRLRTELGPWRLDEEISAHHVWQFSGRDDGPDSGSGRAGSNQAALTDSATTTVMPDPHGAEDTRVYWRGELGYHPTRWGVGAYAQGVYRHGTWHELDRQTRDLTFGVLTRLDF